MTFLEESQAANYVPAYVYMGGRSDTVLVTDQKEARQEGNWRLSVVAAMGIGILKGWTPRSKPESKTPNE